MRLFLAFVCGLALAIYLIGGLPTIRVEPASGGQSWRNDFSASTIGGGQEETPTPDPGIKIITGNGGGVTALPPGVSWKDAPAPAVTVATVQPVASASPALSDE